jgi:hypothetical protein
MHEVERSVTPSGVEHMTRLPKKQQFRLGGTISDALGR